MLGRITRSILVLTLTTAAAAGAGTPPGAVLGADGEIYRIEQGSYGELMGQPNAAGAGNSVLALRVQRADRADELYPIPATLGPEVESAAALLFEEASDSLFVAWESRTNVIHSQILLAGFSGGTWTDPVRVSDSRFSLKSDPRLAVTRDTFDGSNAEGETVQVRRTVLHVAWFEERAEGTVIAYSPVVLVDGVFDETAASPIVALTELFAASPEEALPLPLVDLPLPLAVAAGNDDHSVILGFVHPGSGRLITVEAAVLSGGVSALGDIARAHIIESGRNYDTSTPGGVRSLGEAARAHIIESGHRYDGAVLAYIADRVRAYVIATAPELDLSDDGDLRSLGGGARAHIIESGVRIDRRGLRSVSAPAAFRMVDAGNEEASHHISLAVVGSRALEGLELGPEPFVLVSPDGADALIAWEQAGQLRYQESRGDGWSEVRALSLSTIDRAQALEIITHRIRNR